MYHDEENRIQSKLRTNIGRLARKYSTNGIIMENLLCNKIVLLGPYVGGFKEEIFIFRPFVE
jgi:hypothetical protein